MDLMLFYPGYDEYTTDTRHHKFLEELLGQPVTTYNVRDHRNNYDHDEIPEFFPDGRPMSDTCWCNIPDHDNHDWPKLHLGYDRANKFIASGDDILRLTKEDITNAS